MESEQKSRRPWVTWLVIGVIVIVFLVLVDVGAVIEEIVNADWIYLGGATAVLLVSYVLLSVRWRYLLGNRPGTSYTFYTMNVSNMANLMTFIPVTAIRIVLMGQHKKVTIPQSSSSITIAIALDWVMKIISLICAVLVGISSRSSTTVLVIGVLLLIGLIAGMLLILSNAEKIGVKLVPLLGRVPRVTEEQAQGIITGFLEGLEGAGTPRQLLVAWLWSFLLWILTGIWY
jgi:uncharacterized membrane protein YbhN (UPF0104 family)